MTEKKFYIPGIIASVTAFLTGFFGLAVASLAAGIFSVVINLKNRSDYRVKIGMFISVLSLIQTVIYIISLIAMGLSGTAYVDYWLFELIFGPAPM